MVFPHTSAQITSFQVTSGANRRQIVSPNGGMISNRVLLKASASSIYVGGGNVTTSNGALIPTGDTAPYLEIWINDPSAVWVIGSGTVYVIIEEPTKQQES